MMTLTSYYIASIIKKRSIAMLPRACTYTCKIDNSSILRQTALHNREAQSKRGYYSRVKLMPDYWDETTPSRNQFAV